MYLEKHLHKFVVVEGLLCQLERHTFQVFLELLTVGVKVYRKGICYVGNPDREKNLLSSQHMYLEKHPHKFVVVEGLLCQLERHTFQVFLELLTVGVKVYRKGICYVGNPDTFKFF